MPGRDRNTEIRLHPVLAYDRIAQEFAAISERRRAYLSGIERLVIAGIPESSGSLLDIGAGDGVRGVRIASAAAIEAPVLLEPSEAMRRPWPGHVYVWPIRAEDLSQKSGSFDVILCLWNVLGHIFPASARLRVLRDCARLLSPRGRMFVDVNHRYNAAQYGYLPTALRMLRDRLQPRETNGDVVVRWAADGKNYATDGHVFTSTEFLRMALAAGLHIEKEFTVSYATGEICRSRFAGNPFYVLRRV